MIDTHIHLNAEEFIADFSEVMQRAESVGVMQMLIPATDQANMPRMHELEAQYPAKIKKMVGLHPTYIRPETFRQELHFVEDELRKGGYIAVGEVGIDLYWSKEFISEQNEAFATQIGWAADYDLPLVIHTRESFYEAMQLILKERKTNTRGVFHCFTGTYKEAMQAIELGFLLGIGGVLTFKNGKIDPFLAQLPLTSLLLETDAPYLAPVPHRGKRNESSFLPLICQKIADLVQISAEEVAQQTTENAKKLFKL
jgi:TatD DNase family protein